MRLALEMKSRWDSSMLIKINKAFEMTSKNKGDLPLSPFKETESGLLDFRGFQLSVPLNRLNIKGIDLSWASCMWSMNNCIFEDSVLQGSVFDGCILTKQFLRCNMASISIKNGGLSDSVFTECDFSGAKLISAMARGAKFIRCNFQKTNLNKAVFDHCLFEDCSFKGAKFKSSSMIGNKYIGEFPDFHSSEYVMLTSRPVELTPQETEQLFIEMQENNDD